MLWINARWTSCHDLHLCHTRKCISNFKSFPLKEADIVMEVFIERTCAVKWPILLNRNLTLDSNQIAYSAPLNKEKLKTELQTFPSKDADFCGGNFQQKLQVLQTLFYLPGIWYPAATHMPHNICPTTMKACFISCNLKI